VNLNFVKKLNSFKKLIFFKKWFIGFGINLSVYQFWWILTIVGLSVLVLVYRLVYQFLISQI
jgi:hypothetical protein